MNPRRNSLLPLLFTIGLAAWSDTSFASPRSPEAVQPPVDGHVRDAAVDPVSWGSVTGGVHDALTGEPIEGAKVVVRSSGKFANDGRTVATTDGAGRYACSAELGRSQKKTDGAKLFVGLMGGGLLPGTFQTDHRIDVDQLTVQVTAPGYKRFEGVLPVRKVALIEYGVRMGAVLLVPEPHGSESFTASQWGAAKIVSLRLEPAIATAGQPVTAELRVECPAPGTRRNGKPYALKGHVRIEPDKWIELKEHVAEGRVHTFRGTFKAPGLKRNTLETYREIEPALESPYELLPSDTRRAAMLQVISSEPGRRQAEQRLSAFQRYSQGDFAGAAEMFASISRTATASTYDHRMAAAMQARLGRHEAALEFLRSAFAMQPSGSAATAYANALLASNQPARAVDECGRIFADYRSKHKESDLPKGFDASFLATLGRAHLKLGDVAKARELADLIARRWAEPEHDAHFEFEIACAEAEIVLGTAPKDRDALARKAEALRDLEAWTKAESATMAALDADPADPALRRNLAYVRLHLAKQGTSVPELDAAISAAEALAPANGNGKQPQRSEFAPWHILGILRAAKAMELLPAAPENAIALLDRAHEAFDQALRRGQQPRPKAPWYYARTIVGTTGFTERGAGPDFDLRQAVLVLVDHPADALAWTELGSAFLDNDLPVLADRALAKAAELAPASVAQVYSKALVAEKLARSAEAMDGYRAVLARTPNHPQAALRLAKLLEDAGDTATAAELRRRHAAYHTAP